MKHVKRTFIGLTVACITIIAASGFVLQNRYNTWRAGLLQTVPTLGLCGIQNEDFFARTFQEISRDNDIVDLWKEAYHARIDELITQQLDDQYFTPVCDAENFSEFLQPTPIMQQTIGEFDAWSEDPEANNLSRLEIGLVTYEVLRSYECALFERKAYMISQITDEIAFEQFGNSQPDPNEQFAVALSAISREYQDQYVKIMQELETARPALEQVLRIVNGKERTKILEAEIDCLQRASLDLRNVTSLAAEANSCLPRIWNSREVYRDPS